MKKANKDKVLAATAKRVAACKICGGKPPLVSFNLPEYTGIRCDTCWEITEYDNKTQ